MAIRHVLLDADGVIQDVPGGWVRVVRERAGEDAVEAITRLRVDELPALRGEGDVLDDFAREAERLGLDLDVAGLYTSVWDSIETSPDMLDLIHRLRAAGYGVHLGSNQERHRAAYMRTTLQYDGLFDVSCYSCDLGAAKPEAAFYERAVGLIGAAPAEVVFVDDLEENVRGARAVGLAAEQWTIRDGMDRLHRLLEAHGVTPAP